MRGSNAAKVCRNVGLAVVDGKFECSIAISVTESEFNVANTQVAAAHGPSRKVGFTGDEQTAYFKMAFVSTVMQRSALTAQKQKYYIK